MLDRSKMLDVLGDVAPDDVSGLVQLVLVMHHAGFIPPHDVADWIQLAHAAASPEGADA